MRNRRCERRCPSLVSGCSDAPYCSWGSSLACACGEQSATGRDGQINAFLLDRLRGLATVHALGAVDATAARVFDAAQSLRVRTMAVLRIAFLFDGRAGAVLGARSRDGCRPCRIPLAGHDRVRFLGPAAELRRGLVYLCCSPAFFEPLRDILAVWQDRAAGVQSWIRSPGWPAAAPPTR